MADELSRAYELGKAHALGVVAEGARYNAEALAAYFESTRPVSGSICA